MEITMTAIAPDTDVITPEVRTDEDGTPLLTSAELAVLFGLTPRRLRRLFRKAGVGCGQGSIYATTADDVQAVLDRITNKAATS
jgi:hypothetical protein